MKALAGLKMAFRLQALLNQETDEPIRGMRERDNHHYALCSHLFAMIRSNRSHRRALLVNLLSLFDEHVVRIAIMHYHLKPMHSLVHSEN